MASISETQVLPTWLTSGRRRPRQRLHVHLDAGIPPFELGQDLRHVGGLVAHGPEAQPHRPVVAASTTGQPRRGDPGHQAERRPPVRPRRRHA
jgi:hypothetical protein